jgi:hypothetical protein
MRFLEEENRASLSDDAKDKLLKKVNQKVENPFLIASHYKYSAVLQC